MPYRVRLPDMDTAEWNRILSINLTAGLTAHGGTKSIVDAIDRR